MMMVTKLNERRSVGILTLCDGQVRRRHRSSLMCCSGRLSGSSLRLLVAAVEGASRLGLSSVNRCRDILYSSDELGDDHFSGMMT